MAHLFIEHTSKWVIIVIIRDEKDKGSAVDWEDAEAVGRAIWARTRVNMININQNRQNQINCELFLFSRWCQSASPYQRIVVGVVATARRWWCSALRPGKLSRSGRPHLFDLFEKINSINVCATTDTLLILLWPSFASSASYCSFGLAKGRPGVHLAADCCRIVQCWPHNILSVNNIHNSWTTTIKSINFIGFVRDGGSQINLNH